MENTDQIKVLMVDDDELIARSTSEYFNIVGVRTAYVTSYDAALDFLEKQEVSLLLLDINLGDKSGFDLCKKVRENYDMPIFFISARTSDDDILIALNIGGDDYIKKPYTLNVLLAKVKTVLDRYEKAKEAAKKVSGNAPVLSETNRKDVKLFIKDGLYLDTATHKLTDYGKPKELRAMEYKLLFYLLENAGRVITKDELFDHVWKDENTCDGTIAVHIRHIREKIESDPKDPKIIKTVYGVGYMVEKTSNEMNIGC
ncbi:MAG: response regulator transcription factor [Lachnospiraceae bacterium]|nr:response regulator transcription factor [Lachnospiraceae bacterium]